MIESDEFPGRVEAVDSVDVRARINGYLQSVHFKPGAEVRKGELLFTLDPRPFEAQVAAAESQVAATRSQLDLARIELKRNEEMWADRATSKREFDDAVTRVRTLESQLKANEAALATARLNLGYTRITAPISGRVGKAEITVGNLVQGEMPPSPVLTTVVSVNPVYVSFQADEAAYLKYIAGARKSALAVSVGLADEDGFPHAGTLGFIDNRVDPASGTVRMRATVDNKSGRFTPGLFAREARGHRAAAHGGAGQRPRDRHRPEPALRARARRREEGGLPRGADRPPGGRAAGDRVGPQAGRGDRRERPAARAARRAGDAADGADGGPGAERSPERRAGEEGLRP